MKQTLLELRAGAYYSNGAYGRAWGVRQLLECSIDAPVVRFKGVAGVCRRREGQCTPEEFRRWARYEVILNENSWQRRRVDAHAE